MPSPLSPRVSRLTVHPAFRIGVVDRRLFGSFVEHLGRGVYGGIYQPGHPSSDETGFRGDVADLVRELGVTTIRYPGGNFVSAYDWRDGIGPREQRPRRLDPAWHSVETNEVGTDEFLRWCAAIGVEPMLAVNLGTGDIRSALQLLEYVNHPSGTTLADQRRDNGSPAPYGVSMWCLGNEMDGPWQIGHLPAAEYGRLAARTGAAMRAIDPDLQLVVCGSSNSAMATFGAWEREVLTETIEIADLISCHQYYRNAGDLGGFLCSAADLDGFIESVAATIIQVRTATRSEREIRISFDEWNVWDWLRQDALVAAGGQEWATAPALLEDRYTLADAVVVGDMIISLLNHADVVAAASLAQLVNVIGPIVAEPDGPAWRQTTFYPFAQASRSVGRVALRIAVDGDQLDAGAGRPIPAVTAAATWSPETGELDIFCVHRHPDEASSVEIDLAGWGDPELIAASTLTHGDPLATNSATHPDAVTPRPLQAELRGTVLQLELAPVSWTDVTIRVRHSR